MVFGRGRVSFELEVVGETVPGTLNSPKETRKWRICSPSRSGTLGPKKPSTKMSRTGHETRAMSDEIYCVFFKRIKK